MPRRAKADDSTLLHAGEVILWQAAPNLWLLSTVALGVLAVASLPALATLRQLYRHASLQGCSTAECQMPMEQLAMGVLALALALVALTGLLLITGGHWREAYMLTNQRLIIRKRLFARRRVVWLPLKGLQIAAGRGLSLRLIARDPTLAAKTLAAKSATLLCLRPVDLRLLHEALPEEALP